MSRHATTSRNHKTAGTIVSAAWRGLAVFLLFTHQALANILCCGAAPLEPQTLCPTDAVEQTARAEAPSPGQAAEAVHCHAAEATTLAQPKVETGISRFSQPSQALPWCCRATPAAEPQSLLAPFDECASPNVAPVFFASSAVGVSAPNKALSPPAKSRPIFLTVSCLLI